MPNHPCQLGKHVYLPFSISSSSISKNFKLHILTCAITNVGEIKSCIHFIIIIDISYEFTRLVKKFDVISMFTFSDACHSKCS